MVRKPLPTNGRHLREFLLHEDFLNELQSFSTLEITDEEFIYFVTHLGVSMSHQLEVRVCLLTFILKKEYALYEFVKDRPKFVFVRLCPFFSLDLFCISHIYGLELVNQILEFQKKSVRPNILSQQFHSLSPMLELIKKIGDDKKISCILDVMEFVSSMVNKLEYCAETYNDFQQLAHTLSFLLFRVENSSKSTIISFVHSMDAEFQSIVFMRMLRFFKPIISSTKSVKRGSSIEFKHLQIENHYRTLTLIFDNPTFASLAFKHQSSSFFLFCNFKIHINTHPELFSI